MTLSEFKAWFDGFTEDMDGAPSEKQWKRIKVRVKEISGVTLTERIFVDRYLPRPWRDYPPYSACSTRTLSIAPTAQDGPATWRAENSAGSSATFDSHVAMMMLGKSDFVDAA